jgi:anti-anti-sigma factor
MNMTVNNTVPATPESTITCGTAEFSTFWMPPSTAIITARGELDAANATEFVEYAWRAGRVEHLVLDLTNIEFIGTAGLSGLDVLSVRCSAGDVKWALVPSRAVTRLLEICELEATLPVQPDIAAAFAAVAGEGAPLLELVAESR